MPKILIHHAPLEGADRASIGSWRVVRPFSELQKHLDWEIKSCNEIIDPDIIS